MENSIKMLDHRTDHATRQMLENVVKRKRKFEKAKSRHHMAIFATLVMASAFLAYLYTGVIQEYSYSVYAMFSAFVRKSASVYFLVGTVSLYGLMIMLKEQRDKKEKEYHDLRCEIVDRSKDLWKKEDEWKSRHIVFEMMKREFDINLYHEKK
ncbi:YpbF family protein [Neobacillus sp. SCS-31]|uniref:YpbF family protein n=1 Tax=Neobacillus oceani TaxID=3115292 RepID=UPI003905B4FE